MTYELKEQIGRGTFCRVFLSYCEDIDSEVAIKMYNNSDKQCAGCEDDALNEIDVLRALDGHANIVELIDLTVPQKGMVGLVMEHGGHSLTEYLGCEEFIDNDTNDTRHLGRQLLLGLAFCHSKGVIHTDIKADNLLIDENLRLRIADFGSAWMQSAGRKKYKEVTTIPYRAPEVALRRRYNEKIDVWSAGCVIYRIQTNTRLFDAVTNLALLELICGKRNPRDDELEERFLCSYEAMVPELPQLEALLEKMLECDPKKRVSAEEAAAHEFFA